MATKKQEEKKEESKKKSGLELAIEAINKAYGKGSILTNNDVVPGVEFLSSQCISLDQALGGGWPRGRIIEIYGPESSGKTTLALHAINSAQALGERAAFIDVEHALDPKYAEALGINMSDLLVSQPDCGDDALNIVELLMRSGEVSIIVIDSVAALTPRQELEKDIGESSMGKHALLMSQAMRKLSSVAHSTGTILIFINQIRMKIGIVFGNPETTPGGNALKFYSSQRVDIRRIAGVKPAGASDDSTLFVANKTKAKIVKNKVASPFKTAEFEIEYGKGINIYADLVDVATDGNIIDKAGSWYAYNGQKIGQGKAKAIAFLQEHIDIADEIRLKVGEL